MGLLSRLFRLFGSNPRPKPSDSRHTPRTKQTLSELARRLGVTTDQLRRINPTYRTFNIPKRSGGLRAISAPEENLKRFQRLLLRRVFQRLPVHPAATAFRRGRSITHHAALHTGSQVVVRMDIRDFFPSITSQRIAGYFRRIGWCRESCELLTNWTTHDGCLPQGAPTSPVLANAVNYRMDVRIAAAMNTRVFINPKTLESLPRSIEGVRYSRYADDLTLSFDHDSHDHINSAIAIVNRIVQDEGYRLHTRKKLRIMRRHDRQIVTGLVVNERVAIPREIRRKLRAVAHRHATNRSATMTSDQLQGWMAFMQMVHEHANDPPA